MAVGLLLGDPVDALIEVTESVDLLILGLRHRRGVMSGSIRGVLAHAHCPVGRAVDGALAWVSCGGTGGSRVLFEKARVNVIKEAADARAARDQRMPAHHLGVHLKAIQLVGVGADVETGQVGSGCLCGALAHPGVISACHGAAGVLNDQDPGHLQQVHSQDHAA